MHGILIMGVAMPEPDGLEIAKVLTVYADGRVEDFWTDEAIPNARAYPVGEDPAPAEDSPAAEGDSHEF